MKNFLYTLGVVIAAFSAQAQDMAALDAAQKDHEMKLEGFVGQLSGASDSAGEVLVAEKKACAKGEESEACLKAMEEAVGAREKVILVLDGVVGHLGGAIENRLPVLEQLEATAK